MEMEEGCIFEVMPPLKWGGKQQKKKKKEERESHRGKGKETENLELKHYAGSDGLAEKVDKENGWKEDSVEKKFEKVDMRQLKEMMGDNMIMVKNLVSMPKTARKFCRNTCQMLMRRTRKGRK